VAVVVDSSVLIDQLSRGPLAALRELLGDVPIFLPPLVVSEVLSGADDPSARVEIGELLQDVPVHQTPLAHWINLGLLRRDLRRHGLNVTIPDAHVAQCALELDATLLTRDAIFRRIAEHVPLRLG
jgi:Predicted nucleic acid-binding protein, contains PIN domain